MQLLKFISSTSKLYILPFLFLCLSFLWIIFLVIRMEIRNEIILIYRSMGSNQTQIPLLCSNASGVQVDNQRRKKDVKYVRKNMASDRGRKDRIYLDEFIGRLTVQECFYAFVQLLGLSFKVLTEEGKVVVCHEICEVNSWGQIQVRWEYIKELSRNNDLQLCANLANVMIIIMQMVKELSIQQFWEEFLEKSKIFGKMMKIIYRQHKKSQLQLFQQLMQDISLFKESNNFTSNLLPAILRLKQNQKEQSIFLGNLKTAKSVHDSILDGFRKKKSVLSFNPDLASRQDYSKMGKSTRFQSTFEGGEKNIRGRVHKISKTQGDAFFNLNIELDKSCIREQKVTKRQRNITRNHISCQYSLNIMSTKPKQESQHKPKVRFRDSKENIFQSKEKQAKLPRMNTFQDFSTKQKSFKNERPNAKSVLQQLARSVEVLDNPSSKSLIF